MWAAFYLGGAMNNKIFSMRISPDILKRLDSLASNTQRTKAGVVRWLIQEAYQKLTAGQDRQSANQYVQNSHDQSQQNY